MLQAENTVNYLGTDTWNPGNGTTTAITLFSNACDDPAQCPNAQAVQCRVDHSFTFKSEQLHCYTYMGDQLVRWEDWCYNPTTYQMLMFIGDEPEGCFGLDLYWFNTFP